MADRSGSEKVSRGTERERLLALLEEIFGDLNAPYEAGRAGSFQWEGRGRAPAPLPSLSSLNNLMGHADRLVHEVPGYDETLVPVASAVGRTVSEHPDIFGPAAFVAPWGAETMADAPASTAALALPLGRRAPARGAPLPRDLPRGEMGAPLPHRRPVVVDLDGEAILTPELAETGLARRRTERVRNAIGGPESGLPSPARDTRGRAMLRRAQNTDDPAAMEAEIDRVLGRYLPERYEQMRQSAEPTPVETYAQAGLDRWRGRIDAAANAPLERIDTLPPDPVPHFTSRDMAAVGGMGAGGALLAAIALDNQPDEALGGWAPGSGRAIDMGRYGEPYEEPVEGPPLPDFAGSLPPRGLPRTTLVDLPDLPPRQYTPHPDFPDLGAWPTIAEGGGADIAPDPELWGPLTIDEGNPQHVMKLQEALRRAGYDPGPIDGVRGPQTRAAENNLASREYDKDAPENASEAYRMAIARYDEPGSIAEIQGALAQGYEMRGEPVPHATSRKPRGDDNIYGPLTRDALEEYMGASDLSLDSLSQDEIDDILFGRMLRNPFWRAQRDRSSRQ